MMLDSWLRVGVVEMVTNYTYRTMLCGTVLVGAVTGLIGCFLYLRRQTMISDVIGHSAIGGVALGFVTCTVLLGANGRSMPALMIGSAVVAVLAVLLTRIITTHSPLEPDAAMAVTLAMFFGGGLLAMRAILHSILPNRGGIESYAFGNASTMTTGDLWAIGTTCVVVAGVITVLWKELKISTFDPVAARVLGFPSSVLDPVIVAVTTVGVVVGVKAVGFILMVGFVVLPAAAARQWACSLTQMAVLSTGIGAMGGMVGSFVAVQLGKVPTGPVIIVVLFGLFVVALLTSPQNSPLRHRGAAVVKEVD